MAAHANECGYSITAQNFFSELGIIDQAPCKQSLSEARAKLSYEGFAFLLSEAQVDQDPYDLWHGHRLMIADGTKITLPRTADILRHIEPPQTIRGAGHYPQALTVTLMNAITGQPVAAEVGNHRDSERDLLLTLLMSEARSNDLWLLDRGLGGAGVYLEFYRQGVDFIHRVKTTGKRVALYVQEFLRTKKASAVVAVPVKDADGDEVVILVRLIRGPKDSEGKRIVFATSLLDEAIYTATSIRELYRRRWDIETTYGRVKNLLHLEKFHGRSWNGVLQEIFANLLLISLSAAVDQEAARRLKVDRAKATPNFKAVVHVVRRHLHVVLGSGKKLTSAESLLAAEKIVEEAGRIIWRKQLGRSYPRVSRQPIKSWNLCKAKKLREFQERGRP